MKQQNKTLEFQRFENTFFKLLDQYHTSEKGYYKVLTDDMIPSFRNLKTDFDTIQNHYHEKWEPTILLRLSKAIKTFESVVEFIDDRKQRKKSRMIYYRIMFSQLDIHELIVLFYHFNLRAEPFPVRMNEFRGLFAELAKSNYMITEQYNNMNDGTISKAQKETSKARRAREKREMEQKK